MMLYKFIYALGIKNVGIKTSMALADYIHKNFNGDIFAFSVAINKESTTESNAEALIRVDKETYNVESGRF